jgi:hypothetical protein
MIQLARNMVQSEAKTRPGGGMSELPLRPRSKKGQCTGASAGPQLPTATAASAHPVSFCALENPDVGSTLASAPVHHPRISARIDITRRLASPLRVAALRGSAALPPCRQGASRQRSLPSTVFGPVDAPKTAKLLKLGQAFCCGFCAKRITNG